MTKDGILAIGIIAVSVVLLGVAIHSLARFVSVRWPIGVPNAEQLPTGPRMGKRLRLALGILCLSFGGLWCLGLFWSRVDPPEVASANTAAVIAAGIMAAGINLFGKAIVTGSQNQEKNENIVVVLAFATWMGISVGLAAWHQMILHIRMTRAEEAIRRTQKEQLEQSAAPLPSAPAGPSEGAR